MVRSFILGMLVVAASIGMSASSNAGTTSRYNPYRSFNASGINYGAQQWERTHTHRSHSHNAYFRHAARGY